MARLCGETREFFIGKSHHGPIAMRLSCQQDLDDASETHDVHWALITYDHDIKTYYEWPRAAAATVESPRD